MVSTSASGETRIAGAATLMAATRPISARTGTAQDSSPISYSSTDTA
jgi:hypothetical protein